MRYLFGGEISRASCSPMRLGSNLSAAALIVAVAVGVVRYFSFLFVRRARANGWARSEAERRASVHFFVYSSPARARAHLSIRRRRGRRFQTRIKVVLEKLKRARDQDSYPTDSDLKSPYVYLTERPGKGYVVVFLSLPFRNSFVKSENRKLVTHAFSHANAAYARHSLDILVNSSECRSLWSASSFARSRRCTTRL